MSSRKYNFSGRNNRAQKGSIMLVIIGFIPIIFTIFFLSYEIINFVNYSIRMQHSTDNSAILIAREGPAITKEEEKILADNMMFLNLPDRLRYKNIKLPSNVSSIIFSDKTLDTLAVTAPSNPSAINYFMENIRPNLGNVKLSSVERYYIPQETAFSLDASLSMATDDLYSTIKISLSEFVKYSYAEVVEYRKDNWISLNAFSEVVNVGKDYQDKLVSKKSREIKPLWEKVASEHRYLNTNDMLSDNGVEGLRQAACIKRKSSVGKSVRSYINEVSTPPLSDGDKFELGLWSPGSAEGVARDILEQAPEIPADLLVNYHYENTPDNAEPSDGGVGGHGGCPGLQLTELTNDVTHLSNRIAQYYPTNTTGTDEGFLWAWRTLMPEWRSVWDAGDAPHDYGKRVEKRIILFTDGEQNKGYGHQSDTQNESYLSLYLEACARMSELDRYGNQRVKVYPILYSHLGSPFKETDKFTVDMQACADMTGGELFNIKHNQKTLKEILNTLSLRQYWVKKVR